MSIKNLILRKKFELDNWFDVFRGKNRTLTCKNIRRNPVYSHHDIGEHTYGTPKILFEGRDAKLIIGKYCSIAEDVEIMLGGEHNVNWITTFPLHLIYANKPHEGHPKTKGNVTIGNDVWIGRGAKILSGVNVGDGSVIAAYSVVTKDVEPYAVVGGNPAKFLKYRFSNDVVRQLIDIKWWNWSDEEVKSHLDKLLSPESESFIDLCKKRGMTK